MGGRSRKGSKKQRQTRRQKQKRKQTRRQMHMQKQKQKGGSIPGISPYAVVVNPMKWDDAKN